ncbi:MAG: alpha/beta hydrolase [Ilumatobacteraceae bacterium]
MTLHPQARIIVDAMAEAFPPPDPSRSGTETRQQIKQAAGDVIATSSEQMASIVDRTVPGPAGDIPIRIYRPFGSDPSDVLPLVVFFHGGGWVVCDLDSHDGLCRDLCNRSGCVWVAVDYRLAPEHRFPVGVEDCYAATSWLVEHADQIGADGRRSAVVGDSAGCNLAAAVALMARDRGAPTLAFQALLYPVIDHNFDTESHRNQGTTNGLTSAEVQYFWGEYLRRDSDADDPYASPLRAESHADLPAALVLVPEHDPLRSEGEAYAHCLADAGVPVDLTVREGMFHSFLMFPSVLEPAVDALAYVARSLRIALDLERP